ncbi:MAG TPA: hypothetical protein VMW80_11960 [Candidatus Dormibacteraeota bacterium]|nr:hypothetical protein [Candidatus Dormibacteraeota bacterium]
MNFEQSPSTRRALLTQLVDPEAARLAYRSFHWQVIGLVIYVGGFFG